VLVGTVVDVGVEVTVGVDVGTNGVIVTVHVGDGVGAANGLGITLVYINAPPIPTIATMKRIRPQPTNSKVIPIPVDSGFCG
jgi:hypothetical protein